MVSRGPGRVNLLFSSDEEVEEFQESSNLNLELLLRAFFLKAEGGLSSISSVSK